MSNFDTLLSELEQIKTDQETLTKSHVDGGEKTDDDDKTTQTVDGVKKDGKAVTKEGDEDGDALTKSLGTIKLDDGTEIAAIDGTLLVKSLVDRMDSTDVKFTGVLSHLVGTIKSQGEMLKSMSDELRVLGGQGRGRKTVITVNQKNEGTAVLAKSEGEGMTGEHFMLKSHAAFDAGKLTGRELNILDVAVRMNQIGAIDQAIVRKVLSA